MSAISEFFVSILEYINGLVGNYAWSVVILTLIFRLCLLPLDIKQRNSMRKQTALQGEIAKINQKYRNDKEKANQKIMQLYKDNGTSPFSGCLPMLIQLPLFIAFYGGVRLLSEHQIFHMYEMMKAGENVVTSGWLWIHNMWQPDTFWAPVIPAFDAVKSYASFKGVTDYDTVMAPLIAQFENVRNGYFILPIIAGASSFLQSSLTQPKQVAGDNNPAASSTKMMKYMFPLITVWICTSSSATFALYWLTSNVVSVSTYIIMDRIKKRNDQKAQGVILDK